MTRRRPILGVALILTAFLAGCSELGPRFAASPSFTPTVLGYEVDENGVLITEHSLTFRSRPGSVGGVVTGYEVEYLDHAGIPLINGAAPMTGSLDIVIPPGRDCATSDPCTLFSPDMYYTERVSEPQDRVVTLPGPFVAVLEEREERRGQARFTFFGIANGHDVEIVETVSIEVPVAP